MVAYCRTIDGLIPTKGRFAASEKHCRYGKTVLMEQTIILASISPRRRELLAQIGLAFTVAPADVDERLRPGEAPKDYAKRLAREKARAAAGQADNAIVIAADTIVVVGGTVLGKPTDAEDARRMLTELSGREHEVVTALAVMDASTGRTSVRTSVTRVWFRALTAREIDAYVATREPLDKAGAYGIQERGALLVERIEGCYSNVVGLPLSLLGEMLRDFGISL